MSAKSPLTQAHLDRDGSIQPYPDPADPSRFAEVVEAFGPIELEYAALRKGCVLLDQPQRGAVAVRGADRLEFLNRMVTQELKGLPPFQSRRSFWLNRKGRIDADLRLTALDDDGKAGPLGAQLLIDVDTHAAARTVQTLSSYVFSEDIELTDASESLHRLGLHGPSAAMLLDAVSEPHAGPKPAALPPDQACTVLLAGRTVLVERWDWLGEIGLELTCAVGDAATVYDALLTAGTADDDLGRRARLRPAGWHACNIARVEAGVPLYFLDFGPESLPHETGVLRDRVSFKKGCYLGQEVVARMEARGHSKHNLVGLRFEDEKNPDLPQAEGGAQVFAAGDEANPIGQVTSSSISPMLGGVPVCFASVRTAHAAPGTKLSVEARAERITAVVQPGLAFWSKP